MTDTTELHTFDFGAGPVAAHRHRNPDGSLGGWVADTARVSGTAWVFGDAQVFDTARVFGDARVFDTARVSGTAWVFGDARVFDTARVSGTAWVFGDAQVFDTARVSGTARVDAPDLVIQVGPVGSRHAMLTVYATPDGPRCTTGCFVDKTLKELRRACLETHGADSPHTRAYRRLATAAFRELEDRMQAPKEGRD